MQTQQKTILPNNLKPTLENWLNLRQNLIVSFDHLCSFRPFDQADQSKKNLKLALQDFCQKLIDYVAMGQFQVFEALFDQLRSNSHCDPLANKRILANILKTTLAALDFNDTYANTKNYQKLEENLSFLFERMAHRFELEDKILSLCNF